MNLYSLSLEERVSIAKEERDPQILDDLFEMYDREVQVAIANNENIKYYYTDSMEYTTIHNKCKRVLGDNIDSYIEENSHREYSLFMVD